MELIAISNPVPVVDEPTLINNLFKAGLECFHIRKPGSDINTLRDLIEGIEPAFYNRISLHQFHEIAPDYEIKRLHFPERDRVTMNSKKRAIQKSEDYILSTSIHDKASLASLSDFDYAFYGPVFNSISKPGYKSTIPANFKLDKAGIRLKVFALGGIDMSVLTKIQAMNFDGIAILGALWNQPHQAVEYFEQLKKNLSA